jgi:predicted  nucleic acid-binding Zn-ribbon protein
VLEDRQLEAMLAEEEAAAVQKTALQELETAQAHFAEQTKKLKKEQEKLHKEVAVSEQEKQATIPSIRTDDLKMYSLLRQKRRGIAVALIADNCCSACGSTLNSALLHAARSPDQINRCDSCGRIIYAGTP